MKISKAEIKRCRICVWLVNYCCFGVSMPTCEHPEHKGKDGHYLALKCMEDKNNFEAKKKEKPKHKWWLR